MSSPHFYCSFLHFSLPFIELIHINNYILNEENNIFAIENVPGTKFPYLRRLILELLSSYANETI